MRIIVFFDLPTTSAIDLKNYRNFRKFLIKEGFMMMQESVYTKITKNMAHSAAIAHRTNVNSNRKTVF